MRTAVIFAFCLTVSLLGVATMSHQLKQQQRQQQRLQAALEQEKRRQRLAEFLATLNPEVMKDCVQQHDTGLAIEMDDLAKCGDFELYSRYLQKSKLDAVKKFRDALLDASSRIEFEDKLAH